MWYNLVNETQHSKDQAVDRGATEEEVVKAICEGEEIPAKRGRLGFRKKFPFDNAWKGKEYETKQVLAIVADEGDKLVVITVFTFYFGGIK